MTVAAAVAACSYHEHDAEDVPANAPPVAVIHNVVDGTLRVAAAVEVVLSAADSSDPNGDVLTYVWSIDSACAASAPADLTTVELRLSALVAGTQCTIAVTVTDPFNASSTASATIVVRNIGAYVAATNCLATYDANSEAEQGTKAKPFCALATGVAAAHDFQIAQVPVSNETQTLSANLLVSDSVTIQGGYDRATWTTTSAFTTIALAGAASSSLHIEGPGANVTLSGLAIARTKACSDDCALIDDVSTNLSLQRLKLGAGTSGITVVSRGATGKVYYGVRVQGPTDGSPPISFSATAVASTGASASDSSTAILVSDAVNANISNVTLTENGCHNAGGIQTARAGIIHIDATTITVNADGQDGSVAFGILEGSSTTPYLAGCGATVGEVCNGSASLTVTGGTVSIGNTAFGLGIAGLGTGSVAIGDDASNNHAHVTVAAQRAGGIATMGVGSAGADAVTVTIDNVNASAVSNRSFPGGEAFAYALSDGIDALSASSDRVVGGGSFGVSVTGGTLAALANSNNVDEVAAAIFRGSHGVSLSNDTLVATSDQGSNIVDRAAGLRLMRVAGLKMSGGSINITNLAATWAIGDLIDGQLSADNLDIDRDLLGSDFSSSDLTLSGTHASGGLQVNQPTANPPFPLRACVHLYGTQTALLTNAAFDCTLVDTGSTQPTTAGVIALSTRAVTITDNVITVSTVDTDPTIRLVGIQDGSRQSDTLGSGAMVIARNQISLQVTGAEAIGVRLTGTSPSPAATDTALVDDNFIRMIASSRSAGILAQSTSAVIAFNSVRGATCVSNCPAAFATGVYAMHLSGSNDVRVLANTFSAPEATYGADKAVPAVVEHDDTSGATAISAIVDNVFGWETDTESPVLLVTFTASDTSLDSPRSGAAYNESDVIAARLPIAVGGNIAQSPLYCPDGMHGSPAGPQAGAASHVTGSQLSEGGAAPTLEDIDDASRGLPSDSGADVITSCQ